MSIWASVTALDGTLDPDGTLDAIPERDEDGVLPDGSTYFVDVATTWYPWVRFTIDTNTGNRPDTEHCSAFMLLSVDEIDALIRCLQFARDHTEPNPQ